MSLNTTDTTDSKGNTSTGNSGNDPINIDVTTNYLSDQSAPLDNQFAFSYTITITNRSKEPVRLLNRHWLITDGNQKVQEVRGKGVVGCQPLINSGDSFTYTSGAILETAIGTMEGSYEMVRASGEKFDAPISMFALTNPAAIH